jgi:DNA repair exonuclease SbcCD nuclease subunit
MTYAILSDQHCHNWSSFSKTNSDGVNNRLQHILNEMLRAADELLKADGNVMIFAGDLFHQRGVISSDVFNPVHETIKNILDMDIKIYAIPGNHDLRGENSDEIGNAIQSFNSLEGFHVITKPKIIYAYPDHTIALIPWNPKGVTDDLGKISLGLKSPVSSSEVDVICHYGINEVFPSMPAHGVSSKTIADFGFKRVFAGHYHNHKVMENGKVISIGATTHHTWRDINSRSGFIIVDDSSDKINFRASRSPEFVEIDENTDETEIPMIVDGNYVRVSGLDLDDSRIKEVRDELISYGAKGVLFQIPKKDVSLRVSASSKTGKIPTVQESVSMYIQDEISDKKEEVEASALKILSKINSEET